MMTVTRDEFETVMQNLGTTLKDDCNLPLKPAKLRNIAAKALGYQDYNTLSAMLTVNTYDLFALLKMSLADLLNLNGDSDVTGIYRHDLEELWKECGILDTVGEDPDFAKYGFTPMDERGDMTLVMDIFSNLGEEDARIKLNGVSWDRELEALPKQTENWQQWLREQRLDKRLLPDDVLAMEAATPYQKAYATYALTMWQDAVNYRLYH